jgi:hypothetical protein
MGHSACLHGRSFIHAHLNYISDRVKHWQNKFWTILAPAPIHPKKRPLPPALGHSAARTASTLPGPARRFSPIYMIDATDK